MHTFRQILVVPLMLCLAVSVPAFAQERHVIDPSRLATTVDQHVARLRNKLEPDPAQPRHLITVRKAGYRFQT